jgi:hypothetical protein
MKLLPPSEPQLLQRFHRQRAALVRTHLFVEFKVATMPNDDTQTQRPFSS